MSSKSFLLDVLEFLQELGLETLSNLFCYLVGDFLLKLLEIALTWFFEVPQLFFKLCLLLVELLLYGLVVLLCILLELLQ